MAIDPSGRILITGFAGFDIVGFVARLEPDGDLDPTFATAGDDGIYFFDEAFPTAETRALDLVRQSNGAIVAVGSIVQGLASQGDGFGIEAWLVLRLTDGGALDGTFNPGGSPPGTRLLFQGSAFAEARAVALQGNKLIVVGIFIEEACCDGPGANGLITAQFFAP
ncbi:MAG TPA: hypothetical protein VEO00_13160, partial [Actinomycetota bacterium]|nr:hypothetical protein [Actinomycetota bacterium]